MLGNEDIVKETKRYLDPVRGAIGNLACEHFSDEGSENDQSEFDRHVGAAIACFDDAVRAVQDVKQADTQTDILHDLVAELCIDGRREGRLRRDRKGAGGKLHDI